MIGNIGVLIGNLDAAAVARPVVGRVDAFVGYQKVPPSLQLRLTDTECVWERGVGGNLLPEAEAALQELLGGGAAACPHV